jgi:hypothetical protein
MTIEEDSIVSEVRAARHRIADFYGNDLRRIAEAALHGFSDYRDSDCRVEADSGIAYRPGRDYAFA